MDLDDIEILRESFIEYAHQNLAPNSCSQYIDVISDYLQTEILNKTPKNEYDSIFDEIRASKIKRKSLVRPALLKFSDFLYDEKFIDKIGHLRIQDKIKEIFPNTPKSDSEHDFLTPHEINNLFSDKIKYKNKEEELLVPLICALSFFCMFKQGDVLEITLADIDTSKRQIRNVRINKANSHLVEWLELDERTYFYLEKYLEYRSNLHTDSQCLLICAGVPVDNPKISNLFSSLKRKENIELLGGKVINQELLIRSMMLYILTSTNGQGLYKILLENELKSSALKYALDEYISLLRNENESKVAKSYSLEDVLPQRGKKSKENILGEYSEENDINKDDLNMFEGFNKQNLQENKITIQRLIRDSHIARELKKRYKNKCQLCGNLLRNSSGDYFSEAHHLKPYNRTHRGDDNYSNLIILCPNCHAQFDDLYYAINPDTKKVHCKFEDDRFHLKMLVMIDGHILGDEYLRYTWALFEGKKI